MLSVQARELCGWLVASRASAYCCTKAAIHVVFVMLGLAASGGHLIQSFAAEVLPAAVESKSANPEFQIVPGERIGPLRLDGKIDDAVKRYGSGMDKPGLWGFTRMRVWEGYDLWIDYDPGSGNILWISIGRNSHLNQWSDYALAGGVRVGSSERNVIDWMGTPQRKLRLAGAVSLYYDQKGIRFTLSEAGPLAGKISSLRIVWPSVARGDQLIVPGTRISAAEIGMPIDKALLALGGGYHRGEPKLGVPIYFWPHLGLSIVVSKGKVVSVRSAKHIPSDALDIRYATPENFGEGSKVQDIKEVFGEPLKTDQNKDSTFLIYRSRGVAFEFDNHGKVTMVDVFRPELR